MSPKWAEKPEDRAKWIKGAGLASTIGIALVVSTVIGYALGSWLDSKLHTAPWLMFVCSLLGIIAGFIEVFRIAAQISRDE